MTSEIKAYESEFERLRHVDDQGEYWSARELMPIVDYRDWRNFNDAINRAQTAFRGLGEDTRGHFSVAVPKTSDQAERGRGRPQGHDYRLSRRACYLVFMNGDPKKPAIAAAQNYFAVKTRQMEVIEQQVLAIPQTYAQALRAHADEVEAREKAELLQAQAEAERDELKPPAEAWNHLADAGHDYDVRTAANILRRDTAIAHMVGPRRLFDWLVANGMAQRKADGRYVPYAAHADHLALKPQSRPDHESGGLKEAHPQLRVTVKGLSWIQQRMREQSRPELVAAPPQETAEVVDIHSVRTSLMRR
jgi:DNA-damage-inducible protein D